MSLSMGTLIGQLIALALMFFVLVVAIRFLMAATRWLNSMARVMERESASGPVNGGDGT